MPSEESPKEKVNATECSINHTGFESCAGCLWQKDTLPKDTRETIQAILDDELLDSTDYMTNVKGGELKPYAKETVDRLVRLLLEAKAQEIKYLMKHLGSHKEDGILIGEFVNKEFLEWRLAEIEGELAKGLDSPGQKN